MKKLAFVLGALLLSASAYGFDGSGHARGVELLNLLPPPPAAGSAAATQDLRAVLAAQQTRTAAESSFTKADAQRTVFRFADVFGPSFRADTLPLTAAFFARVNAIDKADEKPVKHFWHRPRPGVVSGQVHPLGFEKANDWSYPSGHSMFAYTAAVLLANMVPEKRAAIFARADLYGHHRVVMGVHFPSDVEAGRIAGTVIAAQLLQDPSMQKEFDAARAELRQALRLAILPVSSNRAP